MSGAQPHHRDPTTCDTFESTYVIIKYYFFNIIVVIITVIVVFLNFLLCSLIYINFIFSELLMDKIKQFSIIFNN